MPIDTKRIISRQLGLLLRQKGLDQITVTELVEVCGISRQAFYYHFQDIIDAMEWGCEQKIRKILRASMNAACIEDAVSVYIGFFTEDRPEIRSLLNSRLHDTSLTLLTGSIRSWLRALQLQQRSADTSSEIEAFALDLYSNGICQILLKEAGKSEESDRLLVERISAAVRGELKLF